MPEIDEAAYRDLRGLSRAMRPDAALLSLKFQAMES